MKTRILAALLLSASATAWAGDAPKVVQCDGMTAFKATSMGAESPRPFTEVFEWAGNTVTVRGFVDNRFSDRYIATTEQPTDGTKTFTSPLYKEELTFFPDTGRFRIDHSEPAMAIYWRITDGTCKKYVPSDVFK